MVQPRGGGTGGGPARAALRLAVAVAGTTAAAFGISIAVLWSRQRRSRTAAVRAAIEQQALEENERRFRSLVQEASDMVTILGVDLRPTYFAPSVQRVLGYHPDEALALAEELLHPEDGAAVCDRLRELIDEGPGRSTVLAFRSRHHDGSWRNVETIATNLLHEPTVRGLVLNTRDVTERKLLEDQLRHRSLHDPLTDLANRALFNDRVEHAILRAGRSDSNVVVALLDLDNFKEVNDSLGHAAGDELLVDLAVRLRRSVRPGDTVARLGGDEFAILLEATGEGEALAVSDRVLRALRQPLVLAGRPIVTHASIGLASSQDTADATALIRNADLAMYAAKGCGKARTEVFRQGMHEAVQARVAAETELRQALEQAVVAGQFRIHYQPKVSLPSGQITGLEALARWQHPERGMIPPAAFIPLAEETGLIVQIGAWVLAEACRQSAVWHEQSPRPQQLEISVNVSSRQFEAGLVEAVAAVLAETGIDPASLCLEVTENVVMKDVEVAIATLRDLKALGVHLAIDNYGSGYSSLGYLKQFPLDELKIDKSFVDSLGRDSDDDAVVGAVMGIAHALDLRVVGEGVETEDQVIRLNALGCEEAQGFYFCRPRTSGEIAELLLTEGVLTGPVREA